MNKILLRKIKLSDKNHFAKWWRDKELIRRTSGNFEPISDKKVEKYFLKMLASKKDEHFLMLLGDKVIGHISLSKRIGGWYETQIIVGYENYRNKGFGAVAVGLLIKKAKRLGIGKIYLEVRPNNARAIRAYEKSGFITTAVKKYPKNKNLPETLRMELGL